MTEDQLVEKIALAMFISDGVCAVHDWEDANEVARVYFRALAKAAIAALRAAMGEPMFWHYERKDPEDAEVSHYKLRNYESPELIVEGWTETPLYAMPETGFIPCRL